MTKSSKKRPRARAVLNTDRLKPRLIKGLQITPSAGGYIVYDSRSERVHYLNHTAGLVMDLCTGKNSWAEIVALVAEAYGLPRKPGRQVGALLRQLEGEGLISLAP